MCAVTCPSSKVSLTSKQHSELFKELRQAKGSSQLKGEALPAALPPPPAPKPSPAKTETSSAATPAKGEQSDSEEEDDDDVISDGGGNDMLDLLNLDDKPTRTKTTSRGASSAASGAQSTPGRSAASKKAAAQAARSGAEQARRASRAAAASENTISNMPAPLKVARATGQRATTRTKGAAAAASASADAGKEAKALRTLVDKANEVVTGFPTWTRETIVHEKDKRFYKACRLQQDSINSKLTKSSALIEDPLKTEAEMAVRNLEAIVGRVKAYTTWVKKGQDSVYFEEAAGCQEFEDREPKVQLTMPTCIQVDELELGFRSGMALLVMDKECCPHEVHTRWSKIDLTELELFLGVFFFVLFLICFGKISLFQRWLRTPPPVPQLARTGGVQPQSIFRFSRSGRFFSPEGSSRAPKRSRTRPGLSTSA